METGANRVCKFSPGPEYGDVGSEVPHRFVRYDILGKKWAKDQLASGFGIARYGCRMR